MKKLYRDENGCLTVTMQELFKLTEAAGQEYYRTGAIYRYSTDNEEYVLIGRDEDLMHFQSFGGRHLFIPVYSLGTFLPWISSVGRELEFVEPGPDGVTPVTFSA